MNKEVQQKEKKLDEVSFIRPILIILLVLYHAFAPWCGAWESFEGFEANQIYWWIGQFAYSFMLPTFVFLSGYIWSFQRETLGKKENIIELVRKKLKRLYVPCMLFSLLYIPIVNGLSSIDRIENIVTVLISCLNGQGHLWFLPMLFWCFVLSWFLLNYVKSAKYRMVIVLFLSYLGFIQIPFQIGVALYYLLFFNLGYQFWLNKTNIIKNSSRISVWWMWLLFIIVFTISTLALNKIIYPIYENASICPKFLLLLLTTTIRIIYSTIGLFAIYISAVRFTSVHELSHWVNALGTCCMGIYIFQQFVLKVLYYQCSWINLVDSDYIPWLAFCVAIIVSSGITWGLRKTFVGKKIL